MITPEETTKLYGFEDYELFFFDSYHFNDNVVSEWSLRDYAPKHTTILLEKQRKHLEADVDVFERLIINSSEYNHKDLLATAKKVFIHPNCGISRTLVANSFKKVNNPWMADVVVIPEMPDTIGFSSSRLFFINEDRKIIIVVRNFSGIISENTPLNTPLSDVMKAVPESTDTLPYPLEWFKEATLFHKGQSSMLNNNEQYIIDLLTQSLPQDKTVFESDMQAALSSEETKLTPENAASILDMLQSSDDSIVGTALKALATMDYMHYINSVKYMINLAGNSCFDNKAAKSTAVKFMFKHLLSATRWRRIGYDSSINADDYKLFEQLLKANESESEYNKVLVSYPFVSIERGFIEPVIKTED